MQISRTLLSNLGTSMNHDQPDYRYCTAGAVTRMQVPLFIGSYAWGMKKEEMKMYNKEVSGELIMIPFRQFFTLFGEASKNYKFIITQQINDQFLCNL